MVALLIVLAVLGLALFLYFKFFKLYKVKSIVFIDGTLGCGKSYYSVALAVRLWKRQVRRWKISIVLLKIGGIFKQSLKEKAAALQKEKPLLYSNILLRNVDFVKLTKELILREKRFRYKSVLLIDEFSLMADQMLYKDDKLNEQLTLFFKLFRHETRGGYCVINSQSTSDLHYSLKYVLSDYLYIHSRSKFPFVTALKVQEMVYCADKAGANVMNVRNEDIEETCKLILSFNKYYKYYDSFCFSIFTDDLPVYRKLDFRGKGESLKDSELVSFRRYRYLKLKLKEMENENQ